MYYKQINSHLEQSESSSFNDDITSDTVVFHPEDFSTDFLSAIYKNKGWDVVTDPLIKNDEVAELINNHDRILCCGHGSQGGLYGAYGFIINSSHVPLLREKSLVCIWCYCDQFMNEHGLTGFYSGMFISERTESLMYDIQADQVMIDRSNDLFASTLGKYIDTDDILKNVKREYNDPDDPIITFNRNRLYSS